MQALVGAVQSLALRSLWSAVGLLMGCGAVGWMILRLGFGCRLADVLPAHYRSLALIVVGVWLWAGNWFLLCSAGIDMYQLLSPWAPSPDGHQSLDDRRDSVDLTASSDVRVRRDPMRRQSLLGIAWALTLLLVLHVVILRLFATADSRPGAGGSSWLAGDDGDGVWQFEGFALSSLFTTSLLMSLAVLGMPFDWFYRQERMDFIFALCRIGFEGLRAPVMFKDVLLADIFCSFSRVFADLYIAMCSVVFELESEFLKSPTCSVSVGAYLFSAVPYAWRLRQCLAEFYQSRGQALRHLYNALKYSTIAPVIIVNYMMSNSTSETQRRSLLIPCSVVFMALNSGYSFYWDVVFDWGLGWNFVGSKYPLLRPALLFNIRHFLPVGSAKRSNYQSLPSTPSIEPILSTPVISYSSTSTSTNGQPSLYYAAIIFNFLARFSWALRLIMLHAGFLVHDPIHLFYMQVLEIFRRFVWIFFRVEKQWRHSSAL